MDFWYLVHAIASLFLSFWGGVIHFKLVVSSDIFLISRQSSQIMKNLIQSVHSCEHEPVLFPKKNNVFNLLPFRTLPPFLSIWEWNYFIRLGLLWSRHRYWFLILSRESRDEVSRRRRRMILGQDDSQGNKVFFPRPPPSLPLHAMGEQRRWSLQSCSSHPIYLWDGIWWQARSPNALEEEGAAAAAAQGEGGERGIICTTRVRFLFFPQCQGWFEKGGKGRKEGRPRRRVIVTKSNKAPFIYWSRGLVAS